MRKGYSQFIQDIKSKEGSVSQNSDFVVAQYPVNKKNGNKSNHTVVKNRLKKKHEE